MEVYYLIVFFIFGLIFGSFYNVVGYRLPKKMSLITPSSHCPKCNHKLQFLDLIPVFSYLFLRGKCRYCGERVRIRYLLLEVLSGLVFLIFYLTLGAKYPFFELFELVYFAAIIMFYITVVIIAGIDKENNYIDKRVLLFGLIMQAIYQLFLYSVITYILHIIL